MLTLVTGGSASGKSDYAERLLCGETGVPRIYIATMQPMDPECEARIVKHRLARAERGFVTVERYLDLAGVTLPAGCDILLECMSNLAANELFSAAGAGGHAAREILRGVDFLVSQARHAVIVSNEVFSDGEAYSPETRDYICLLGEINQAVAQRAQRVAEVVYTIPILHKEEIS